MGQRKALRRFTLGEAIAAVADLLAHERRARAAELRGEAMKDGTWFEMTDVTDRDTGETIAPILRGRLWPKLVTDYDEKLTNEVIVMDLWDRSWKADVVVKDGVTIADRPLPFMQCAIVPTEKGALALPVRIVVADPYGG